MPFKPGCNPNPAGRPRKGKSIPDILRKLGRENLEPALAALYDLAKSGDVQAMNFIADRTEGKVAQVVRVEDSTIKITLGGKRILGGDSST